MPDLQPAHGTWFIVQSTLSRLWRTRADGALNYLPLPGGEMCDVVTWQTGRGQRSIVGFDRPLHGEGGWDWEWRGAGPLTRHIRSRWSFTASSDTWAVSLFERTPFTATGVDLCFREQRPDLETVERARRACLQDPRTAQFHPSLFETARATGAAQPAAWRNDHDA